ncbi:MAG: DUF1592 domain-containing protein [Phycisphaerae bacterium]|nr:DUF1592 domain-containing protein [Phycisphaerae bacterium]
MAFGIGSAPAEQPAEGKEGRPAEVRDALKADLDARFALEAGPFLAAQCLKCHAGEEPQGDLSLEALARDGLGGAGEVNLRLVRDMIAAGDMPPPTRPRPGEHERTLAVQWLEAAIAYVPMDAAVDPGWFTPHRLNRTEYLNTVRDLLGEEALGGPGGDLAERLPRDDTGYGFDNIADVLSVSPLAVEQYLASAERVVEAALGPVVEVGDVPRVVKPLKRDNGQPLPRGGAVLYSNGAVRGRIEVPAEGEYVVRVRAWEDRGGEDHARMVLRTGGREVRGFEVTGRRGEPQEFEARVRVKAGTVEIAAHFTNDYYVKDKADRNLGVETITIAGPLDEATTVRREGWRRVFAPGVGARDEGAKARAVLGAFARRAYRRPASSAEVQGLMGVYESERRRGARFEPAVRAALSACLVSPAFLFRTIAHPDPRNPGAVHRLSGYEVASRLSYFLWSSMPDEALLAAAADGRLATDEGLSAQVRRMLADPRSAALVKNFTGQWLHLRGLETLAIDRTAFPDYDDDLRQAMREEAERSFADVLSGGEGGEGRSVLELVESRHVMVNARLARHYGIEGVTGPAFRRVALPEGSARGGVLTMAGVLTATSNPTRTSPVKRGLFVLEQLLGVPPPPPPADIPPLEQAKGAGPGATVRERLAAHTTMPGCAACHNRLDPLGLSLEHFDAVGRWRDSEEGRPIDATGELPGGERLDGAAGVKRSVMARADQFVETLAGKLLAYAIGRGFEPFDRPAIRRIAVRTRERGDRLDTLIESIVLSETFRTARGREEAR